MNAKGYFVEKNRIIRAKKIESVLKDYLKENITNKKILDIGTGNGEIAEYFILKKNDVYMTDINNNLKNKNQKNFFLVNNEILPFADNTFDIIISNHVIEHTSNQSLHLSEIKRVLKDDGICYFATPNRFFIKDPHTKTFFMHYLPYELFFKCLKLIKKYQEEFFLLSYFQMKSFFKENFFIYTEYTSKVFNNKKKFYLDSKIKLYMPKIFEIISPTNIFILKKH